MVRRRPQETRPTNPRRAAVRRSAGTRVQPEDHGWTEETRVVDGVYLTVLSDDNALRQRILDSARPIDGTDSYGCPPNHPLAAPLDHRPIADSAAALAAAILDAPEGFGPDDLGCIDILGHELIVLKVRAGAREQEVLVRYAGCHFNGTDDSTTHRRLTAAVVRPLLAGPHQQTTYNSGLYDLVHGHSPIHKP